MAVITPSVSQNPLGANAFLYSKRWGPLWNEHGLAWAPSTAFCAPLVTAYIDSMLWFNEIPLAPAVLAGARCLLMRQDVDLTALLAAIEPYQRVGFSQWRGFNHGEGSRMFRGEDAITQVLRVPMPRWSSFHSSAVIRKQATLFMQHRLPALFGALHIRSESACTSDHQVVYLECDKDKLARFVLSRVTEAALLARKDNLTTLFVMCDVGEMASTFFFSFYTKAWAEQLLANIRTSIESTGLRPMFLSMGYDGVRDTGAYYLTEVTIVRHASWLGFIGHGGTSVAKTAHEWRQFHPNSSHNPVGFAIDPKTWTEDKL